MDVSETELALFSMSGRVIDLAVADEPHTAGSSSMESEGRDTADEGTRYLVKSFCTTR